MNDAVVILYFILVAKVLINSFSLGTGIIAFHFYTHGIKR